MPSLSVEERALSDGQGALLVVGGGGAGASLPVGAAKIAAIGSWKTVITPSNASSSMPAVTIVPERSACEYRFALTARDYKLVAREVTMPIHSSVLCASVLSLLLAARALAAPPATDEEPAKERRVARSRAELVAKPKYYFKIVEVNVGKDGSPELAKIAREDLVQDLSSRPQFTADVQGASDPAALLEELKRRGLKGFDVSLRLDRLGKNLKEPKPGGRLKQLSVDVKVSVFGTTYPGEKLAFSGEGEAVVESEIVEARLEQEAMSLVKEVLPQALKQAVDQAVLKLSLPQSAPMNESKRRRKK
jgi:hypothetical protein